MESEQKSNLSPLGSPPTDPPEMEIVKIWIQIKEQSIATRVASNAFIVREKDEGEGIGKSKQDEEWQERGKGDEEEGTTHRD